MSYTFFREKDFVNTQRGKYPKEWEFNRFDSIITLEYGKGLPELRRKQGRYPVFGSNGVVGYHDRSLVKGPGIVVGRKGTIGAVTLSKSDFWPIDTTYYVRMKTNEVDLNWLFYELVHLNLPRLSSADVVPGLKRELVNNLILPLPPLAEQRKIANILAIVDSNIELAGKVIAKTERLKKGLMQQLLTEGLNVLTIYHDEITSVIEDCRKHVTTSEWNLTHHLAESLKRVFEKYDVDVELIKDPTNERPDIVVHKRGTNDYNLLVIEVKIKPTNTEVKQDVEKLERLMLGKYLYRSALFVGYDTALKNEETFSLSKEVNFILVRPDGRLDSKFVEDHKKHENTPIGNIPKDWELVRIRELGELQYGYTAPAVQDSTGTKFLRITDIEEDGSVNWEQVPYCHIDENEFDKYALREGDLLFARIGATAGKTTYINENARGIFASYLIRLRVTERNVDPKFVFYFTQSNTYWSQALRQREGQLKKGINATMLSNFVMPNPSFEEQHRIAEILSAIDYKLKHERKEKARLERVKWGLMDLLLTGKVRIKVD